MTSFPPFNQITRTRHGPMIVNRNDCYIGRSLRVYGEFSRGELELFEEILEPGDVVVEAGANIGAHTIFLAQRVGAAGAVHAYEPQRAVFQTLCGNLALNHVTNVYAWQAALGSCEGTVEVPELDYTQTNNYGGLALNQHYPQFPQHYTVPCATIDQLELPACKLIKIDVEGMEQDVLKGAQQTIERCRPVLYVEADREDKLPDLIQYLISFKYAMFRHFPALFHAGNYKHVQKNVFGNLVSKNLLCVHNEIRSIVDRMQSVHQLHAMAEANLLPVDESK